jgi:hypothetical protein
MLAPTDRRPLARNLHKRAIGRIRFNKTNQAEMAIANCAVTRLSIDVKGQETESAAIT